MEDYELNDVCVVGSLFEENNSTIEWILKDFQKFFRMWTPNVVLRSQVFQMKDAPWRLSLYFRTFKKELALCASVYRQKKYDIKPTTCHVVVLVEDYELGDFELGDYVRNMPVKKQLIYGPIRRTVNLRSRKTLNFRSVRVRCTFNQEIEDRTTRAIAEDVPEQGNHSREKTEGLDILVSHMKNLFLSQENGDFVITVKDKEFQVHKAILSARCPVLASMLQSGMEEKNSNATEIVDYEPDIFEQFLLYLYTGRVEELSSENAVPLYILGHKYDIEHLMKECAKCIAGNLCVEKFCDTIRLGWRHDLPSLVKKAENLFLENAVEVMEDPKWPLLMAEYSVACNELYIKYSKRYKKSDIMYKSQKNVSLSHIKISKRRKRHKITTK